jgi:hypothetical protein
MSALWTLWLAMTAPDMTWSADPACPGQQDVVAMTAGLLAEGADTSGVIAVATVEQRVDAFALTLEIRSPDAAPQVRTLVAPRCEALAKATALLVAMAIDPLPVAARIEALPTSPQVPEPVVDPAAPTPSSPVAAAAPIPTVDATPPRRRRTRGSFGLFAGPGIGVQPRVTGVFGARAGLSRGRLRVELGWRHTLPTVGVYGDRPGLGARIYGWAASARACYAPSMGPVALPLCAGALAGRTRANGQGTDADRVVHTPRLAAVASAGLRWRFADRFVLTGTVDIELPVVRSAYNIEEFRDPTRDVYVETAVAVIPSLGLEVEFPR